MENQPKLYGAIAIGWAFIALLSFIGTLLLSQALGLNIYDAEAALRVIEEQPLLITGRYLVFSWLGVALVLMVLAFNERLAKNRQLFLAKTAVVMGLIAGALYMFCGLVGGFSSADLSYVLSHQGTGPVREAYLPFTLVTNRGIAAALAISGFWFIIVNWIMQREESIPKWLAYLGLGLGIVNLSAFVQPGADYGLLLLPLAALWSSIIGWLWFRKGIE